MAGTTLADAVKSSQSDLVRGVMPRVITTDQVFSLIPFDRIGGHSELVNEEDDSNLGNASFIGIGEGNNSIGDSVAQQLQKEIKIKPIAEDFKVDHFLQTVYSKQNNQANRQIAAKSKVVGRLFSKTFVTGNEVVRSKEFSGLLKLNLSSQRLNHGSGGAKSFTMDYFDWLADMVKVGSPQERAFMCHSRVVRQLLSDLRSAGYQPEYIDIPNYGRVDAYRGFPILKNDWFPTDGIYRENGGPYYEQVENATEVAPDWAVGKAYVLGDVVKALAGAHAGTLFECTTAGTSHATTEPTWDAVDGNTTADNTVTWTARTKHATSIMHAFFDTDEGVKAVVPDQENLGVSIKNLGEDEDTNFIRYRARWYVGAGIRSPLAIAEVPGVKLTVN